MEERRRDGIIGSGDPIEIEDAVTVIEGERAAIREQEDQEKAMPEDREKTVDETAEDDQDDQDDQSGDGDSAGTNPATADPNDTGVIDDPGKGPPPPNP